MQTTEELVRIALAGGGLDLRNRKLSTQELVRIAMAAAPKKTRVKIMADRTTEELVRIVMAGRGCVEVTDT
jgi:hypothetical protein